MTTLTLHAWRRAILSDAGPTPAIARLVALAFAQDMDSRTLATYSSAARIATVTGLSERCVRGLIHELSRQRWLSEQTASRGRAHWRKVRRAVLPSDVVVTARRAGTRADGLPERGAGSPDPVVAARPAGTGGVAAGPAASQSISPEVPANHDASGGSSLHRVAARRAADLVDLSRSDLGAASPSPAAAGSAARTRRSQLPALTQQEIHDRIVALIALSPEDTLVAKMLRQYGVTADAVRELRAVAGSVPRASERVTEGASP